MSATTPETATAAPGDETPPPIPPVKVIFGGGGKGMPQKVKKIEGEALLAAMAGDAQGVWLVRRDASESGGQLGTLPVRLSAADMDPLIIDAKLGEGTYAFISKADPSKCINYTNASRTPSKNFGAPAEEEAPDVFVAPNGVPYAVPRPQRTHAAPMPAWGMPAYGAGAWAQPQQGPDPTTKAMLEAMLKAIEKLGERKNDGPSPDTLVKLEQIKADAMVNAAKEQRLQREAELKAKEAELKARADADRDAAREQAKAQAEAAKANAEAAREQAKAFQQAQAEAAKAAAEAAKESAKAQIEAAREAAKATEAAAKERSQNERQQFERWMSWQEKLEQRQPEPEDPFKTFQKISTLLETHKVAGDGGVGALIAGADSLLSKIVLLRMTAGAQQAAAPAAPQVTATVTQQNPAPATGTPAPAQVEAPKASPAPEVPMTEEQKAAAEARALAMQVMDGLSTLIDGARRTPQTDPVKMAQLLRERLPRVADWLRTSNDLLADLGNIFATPAFTEAERQKALQARGVLAEHLTWLASVIGAVKM